MSNPEPLSQTSGETNDVSLMKDVNSDCDKKPFIEDRNDNGTSNDLDDGTKTNLIVNYIPQRMTDDEFEDLFKKFGSMKSCKIVRNRVSGYSYGFGFVDFETHDQAIKAIEELNGYELDKKRIKVAFARPAGQDIKQANLYVKNVPNEWTQDDVRKVFEPYGNIIQVRVLGKNRGIAFVLYDLRKQAEDALEALNGKTIEGCEAPFEIKFAADKKSEKSSAKETSVKGSNLDTNNSSGGAKNESGSSSTSGLGSGANNSGGRRKGNRGGRNRNHGSNIDQRRDRQNNQRSFFDRQNNDYADKQHNRTTNQGSYNSTSYAGGAQYQGNFGSMNGTGPLRHTPNRFSRYAPFVPMQQSLPAAQVPTSTPLVPAMVPGAQYGYTPQQTMIPFTLMPTQPIATMHAPNQAATMSQVPMPIYGAAQMPISYAPMTQNAMNNMYNVASNNLNNAANLQPQLGQPMISRNNNSSGSGGAKNDDGVTLFVYNLGPNSDENELKSMFSHYGHVVKCNVVRKSPNGETRGFGFVTLKDRSQADAAIAGLDGTMRNGRALQVSLKK